MISTGRFARRFGGRFDAETLGEALLRTVMANPDCEAVQVNSALAEVSLLIPREVVERLLKERAKKAEEHQPSTIPWWQFW